MASSMPTPSPISFTFADDTTTPSPLSSSSPPPSSSSQFDHQQHQQQYYHRQGRIPSTSARGTGGARNSKQQQSQQHQQQRRQQRQQRPLTPPPRSLLMPHIPGTATTGHGTSGRGGVGVGIKGADDRYPIGKPGGSGMAVGDSLLTRLAGAVTKNNTAADNDDNDDNDNDENNNDSSTTNASRDLPFENSMQISELTTTSSSSSSSPSPRLARMTQTAATTTTTTNATSTATAAAANNNASSSINSKQKAAMEAFLSAPPQNPHLRQEKWKELVRSLANNNNNNNNNNYNYNNNDNNNGIRSRTSSYGSNKSSSTSNFKNDDILGLIQIGGGMMIGGEYYNTSSTHGGGGAAAAGAAAGGGDNNEDIANNNEEDGGNGNYYETVSMTSGLTSPTTSPRGKNGFGSDDTYSSSHFNSVLGTPPRDGSSSSSSSNNNNNKKQQHHRQHHQQQQQQQQNQNKQHQRLPLFPLQKSKKGGQEEESIMMTLPSLLTANNATIPFVSRGEQSTGSNGTNDDGESSKDFLPSVSPITHEASLDDEEEGDQQHENGNVLNVTGETTIPSPKDGTSMDGNDGKKKYSVFFDIGESSSLNNNEDDGDDLWNSLFLDDNGNVTANNDGNGKQRQAVGQQQHQQQQQQYQDGRITMKKNTKQFTPLSSKLPKVPLLLPPPPPPSSIANRNARTENNSNNRGGQYQAAKLSVRTTNASFFQRTTQELRQQQQQQQQQLSSLPITPSSTIPPSPLPPPSKRQLRTTSPSLMDNSQRSRKRREGNGTPCSLEEQVRNVLAMQKGDHGVEEEEEEEEEEGGYENDHDDAAPVKNIDQSGSAEQTKESAFSARAGTPSSLGNKPTSKKAGRIKKGSVQSAASADDILRELMRSPTPSSLQCGLSLNSSGNMRNSKPPLSISIGGGTRLQAKGGHDIVAAPTEEVIGENSSTIVHNTSMVASESSPGGNAIRKRSPTSPSALAPSRRDLPRPNRLYRRSISEPDRTPNCVTSHASVVPEASPPRSGIYPSTSQLTIKEEINSVNDTTAHSWISASNLTAITESTNGSQEKSINSPHRVKRINSSLTDNPFDEAPSPIPVETSTEHVVDEISASIGPDTTIVETSMTASQDVLHMLPLLSAEKVVLPSRLGLAPSKRDIRPASLSRRRSAPSPVVHPPSSPPIHIPNSSPPPLSPSKLDNYTGKESADSFQDTAIPSANKPKLDEIRASIDKLKYNGVGGVGKTTSILVRNRETGRYIIRDVDDAVFDDIIQADMMRPKLLEEDFGEDVVRKEVYAFEPAVGKEMEAMPSQQKLEAEEPPQEQTTNQKESFSNVAEGTPVKFKMTNAFLNTSMLSDDAVDDAVRLATDGISASSASTDDISSEVGHQQQVETMDAPPMFIDGTPPRKKKSNNRVKARELESFNNATSEDDDDFFVIQRPSQSMSLKWSTFQANPKQAYHQDVSDFHTTENSDRWDSGSDSFTGGSPWDDEDSSSEEWGNDKDGFPVTNSTASQFVSPTSVAAAHRKNIASDVVQVSWDPFAM